MKIAAVITEFNPFHNGHAYFLKTVRERSQADHLIAVMSGDFVQRGEPAIVSKYRRAEMALHGGCDLVFELPLRYALGSAGDFASGAFRMIDSLGVVDELWFGSECGSIDLIRKTAEVLTEEPPLFREVLKERLRQGDPYPKARETGLAAVNGPETAEVLNRPNNILGLEYTMAAMRAGSRIRLQTVRRLGAGYHSAGMTEGYASALAIRQALRDPARNRSRLSAKADLLKVQLPDHVFSLLESEPGFLSSDDFSVLLKYRLMEETSESLTRYAGISSDLANRIKNLENECTGFTEFALKVKTKNVTFSHIARALFHILLKIPAAGPSSEPGLPPAIRMLGMGNCEPLLKAIREAGTCLLFAGAHEMPADSYAQDLFASNLYESVKAILFGTPFRHETENRLVRL